MLDESQLRILAAKIAEGLEYLHSHGIILRNLQLNSIRMSDKTLNANPRIANFDKATIIGGD